MATLTAIRMPVQTTEILLDEIGYTGWRIVMRTNPRSSVYDKFLSMEKETEWEAFGQLVVEWNFVDEEGNLLPLPKDGTARSELPYQLLKYIYKVFIDKFNESMALPKELDSNLEITSTTSTSRSNNGVE